MCHSDIKFLYVIQVDLCAIEGNQLVYFVACVKAGRFAISLL